MEPRAADGIREVRRIFQTAPNPPRFPMYVRQARQFMRNVDPTFDERKFGFGTLQDLLRACQRDGLFRIERDRQGVIRLFPGNVMQPTGEAAEAPERESAESRVGAYSDRPDRQGWGAGEIAAMDAESDLAPPPADSDTAEQPEPEVVEGDLLRELDTAPVIDAEGTAVEEAAPAFAPNPEPVREAEEAGREEAQAPAGPRRMPRPRTASSARRKTESSREEEAASGGRARKQPSARSRPARPRGRKGSGGD